jgi:diamine N-acetyltransferase
MTLTRLKVAAIKGQFHDHRNWNRTVSQTGRSEVPMLEFRKVVQDDLEAVCALVVAPGQADLVTPNVMTMAQAQFEPGALVQAMWQDGKPVGLLAMKRPSAYPVEKDIIIRRDLAYVWRLMVGKEFQGRGLGYAALDEAKRKAKEWGYTGMSLTVSNQPHSATSFYEKYGFGLTGRKLWNDDNELEMIHWFAD